MKTNNNIKNDNFIMFNLVISSVMTILFYYIVKKYNIIKSLINSVNDFNFNISYITFNYVFLLPILLILFYKFISALITESLCDLPYMFVFIYLSFILIYLIFSLLLFPEMNNTNFNNEFILFTDFLICIFLELIFSLKIMLLIFFHNFQYKKKLMQNIHS